MKKILYTFLISSLSLSSFATIDSGDGSDGVCNWSGNIASGTYNCTDLTINSAVTITGTSALIIKVQGDVNISSTLNLNGKDGSAGGTGVAGGYDRGSGPVANTAGNMGIVGGLASGGGSGGSHKTLGAAGAAGGGTAGAAPTMTYDSEANFKTTMTGGAGGGNTQDDANISYGSDVPGGGGGGVLRISSGGTITISGTISANGGSGDSGLGDSGGGGGGAGGAIFLECEDQINLTGTISATGGAGGTKAGTGGNGGAGGNGLIRLDDYDGSVSGGTVTPSAYLQATSNVSGTSNLKTYTSDIAPGCALRENQKENDKNFFLSFLLLISIIVFSKRYFLKNHQFQFLNYKF